MRKLKYLFLVGISFVNLGKVHAMPEFIFAANVPVYVPFESDLLKSVSALELYQEEFDLCKKQLDTCCKELTKLDREMLISVAARAKKNNSKKRDKSKIEDEIFELNSKKKHIEEDISQIQGEISEKFRYLAIKEIGYLSDKCAFYDQHPHLGKSSQKIRPFFESPCTPEQISHLESIAYYYSNREFKIDKDTSPNWRGAYKSYDLKKLRKKPNYPLNRNQDGARVSRVINLFEKESFGTTNEESMNEFSKRFCLAILANRPKSVLSVQNASLKEEDDDPRAVVIKGAWSPKWMVRRIGGVLYNEASHDEVRQYVRYCLGEWYRAERTPVTNQGDYEAKIDLQKKWQDKVIAILKQEYNVSEHVPYRELREALRISEDRCLRLINLLVNFSNYQFSTNFNTCNNCNDFMQFQKQTNFEFFTDFEIFEATHDSDLLGLRVQTDRTQFLPLGLYSYYTLKLQEWFAKFKSFPNILTTGYRAAYEEDRYLKLFNGDKNAAMGYYAWIYQAIENDRYARASACTVDFRASYICEPNALFFVPRGGNWPILPYSFLCVGDDKEAKRGEHYCYDNPRESLIILKQIYREQSKQAKILFAPYHPVLMSVPDRMLKCKKSGTTFNLEDYGIYSPETDSFQVTQENFLKFAANISQTPFASRDYAIMLYSQLGLSGNKFFVSLPGSRKQSDRYPLEHPNGIFTSCVSKMFKYYLGEEIFQFMPLASQLDPIKGMYIINDVPGLVNFMNKIFKDKVGSIVKKIAEKIICSNNEHYECFVTNLNSSARTSARSSMERSQQREGYEALDLQPMTSGRARLNRSPFSRRSPSPEPRTPSRFF